jgi:hypothetical protein
MLVVVGLSFTFGWLLYSCLRGHFVEDLYEIVAIPCIVFFWCIGFIAMLYFFIRNKGNTQLAVTEFQQKLGKMKGEDK